MTDWTRRKTSDLLLALMARASGPPPDLIEEIDRRFPQRAPTVVPLSERKLSERKKEYLRLGGGNYPNAIHEAYRANDDKAVKSLRRDREAL